MEGDLLNSSVLAAYIKRFREQSPLPESERAPLKNREDFWWLSPDQSVQSGPALATQPASENDGSVLQSRNVLPDLSLSEIRELQSSAESGNRDFADTYSQIPTGNDDEYGLGESHESLKSSDSDESLSNRVAEILQRCNQLQQSTERFHDTYNIPGSSNSPQTSTLSPKISLESLRNDMWENSSYHSTASDHEESPSQLLGVENKDHTVGAIDDTSECDSTASSSVFYELSPSASISASYMPPARGGASVSDPLAASAAKATLSVADRLHQSARPPATLPVFVGTFSETATMQESCRRDEHGKSFKSNSVEVHLSPVLPKVPIAESRLVEPPAAAAAAAAACMDHTAHEAAAGCVNESIVRRYLDTDDTLAELWRRLVSVREQAAHIRGVLSQDSTKFE